MEEYEEEYSDIQTFLPFGVKANESHVQLEKMSESAKVELVSLSRVNDKELIEDVSEDFLKDTYTATLSADNPIKLRSLIDSIMNQDRVWNISSFSYSQSGEENYSADLTYNLYYRLDGNSEEN